MEIKTILNGICPYFTMFPLDFPLRILEKKANPGERVLDPFCGRGTTNFAARLLGLFSLGVDSNPVAVAITEAKLVNAKVENIVKEAETILHEVKVDALPEGEFWQWAYHPSVLTALCKWRKALLEDCRSAERKALRGIILGALHGPQPKYSASYFSNQCPRTYAPKPRYALNFWKKHKLHPKPVDVIEVVRKRAERFYAYQHESIGEVKLGDSRQIGTLRPQNSKIKFHWVITSPPYYGMHTYLADQWLRLWFLGGPPTVEYRAVNQLSHKSPSDFVKDLATVWNNVAALCESKAWMVIRFGSIPQRKIDGLQLIRDSLKDTPWQITGIHDAGSASNGLRQANSFLRQKSQAKMEHDIWARLE
ncbi:MAG: site-specific DNA-methyltransferase [Leptospiraceae bacterium]|nr:site-specific DNA-methyltransferase [Leptospiraceae bacterium]